jgi:aldehyde:ferredoxin oxidoreductase
VLIWRVNLREGSLQREKIPEAWSRLGGRGLLARIMVDETPARCEPLGPDNRLIFSPGLLVGHMLSSCDRISVGGKSPLTGGIKEANAGGTTGLQMACLGIRALILEGQVPSAGHAKTDWRVLHLSPEGARLEPCADLAGLGVAEASEKLLRRYGDKVAIALIGPAGEMGLWAAGIQNLDKERRPSRIAARGGLGAVMGAKGLKAVVVDAGGCARPPIAAPEAFKEAQKLFSRNLADHAQTALYRDYGTAAMALTCNALGALPTRAFSSGRFEAAEAISGEHLREVMLERGGDSTPTHACMPGCAIRCSNTYGDAAGRSLVSPLEYETLGLMGSNLGIADLDAIARMNAVVNDLGLDSIDLGAALGVACRAGLMAFGDSGRALELLDEIRRGTPLGRTLGHGAAMTGKVLGVLQVPVVKGQAMSAYEPRAIKGTGVTYATSPQGADHTAGNTVRAKCDHLDPTVQAALSRGAQINMAGYDTLGACIFAGFGFAVAPEVVPALLNARYGWEAGPAILQELGRETLTLEREFNRRAGFTAADDRLPEWMTREPLPPHESVFDVSEADLDGVFDW